MSSMGLKTHLNSRLWGLPGFHVAEGRMQMVWPQPALVAHGIGEGHGNIRITLQ